MAVYCLPQFSQVYWRSGLGWLIDEAFKEEPEMEGDHRLASERGLLVEERLLLQWARKNDNFQRMLRWN
jgi:hypothetical protein